MSKQWISVWVMFFLLASAGTVSLRLWIVQKTYALRTLEKQLRQKHLELERKRLELAHLRSPGYLIKRAHQLGLIPPMQEQKVHLK